MTNIELIDIIVRQINEMTDGEVTAEQLDTSFENLQLDSLLFVLLLCNLETELGVEIEYSDVDFECICTIRKLASYLEDNVLISK